MSEKSLYYGDIEIKPLDHDFYYYNSDLDITITCNSDSIQEPSKENIKSAISINTLYKLFRKPRFRHQKLRRKK